MTRLKSSNDTPFHRNVVLAITNACNGRCDFCYQHITTSGDSRNGRIDFPARLLEKNVVPYLNRPVGHHGRPAVTLIGGEACLHPEFLQILNILLSARPKSLDVYTNGALFRRHGEEFFKTAKNSSTPLSIVYSFDMQHIAGVPKNTENLHLGLSQLSSFREKGGRAKFVVVSTRLGEIPAPIVEAELSRLKKEFTRKFKIIHNIGTAKERLKQRIVDPVKSELYISPDGGIYLGAEAFARGISAVRQLLIHPHLLEEKHTFGLRHISLLEAMRQIDWTYDRK